MKYFISFALLYFTASVSSAQLGIKAGLNFANVSNASTINNSSRTGFHAGIFLAPPSMGVLSSRTELIFSRQGYNYKTNTNTGNINLDYIILPQYMAINITKFFQLQLGGQMAILLNAKADSSVNNESAGPYSKVMDYYNRFDYGYGGGIEVHPVLGLIVGARVNISLGNIYKNIASGASPSFIPKVDVKNNVFQIYAGWRFGKNFDKMNKPPTNPGM
jgi:Outer membrane protein beta-barrel domain